MKTSKYNSKLYVDICAITNTSYIRTTFNKVIKLL